MVPLPALGPGACRDIRCGEKDVAPWLDSSVTLTSCLQLGPAAQGATVSSRSAEHCSALLSW